MPPQLRTLFRFEHQQSQRDRLRQWLKPRVERLEDRLSPTVNVFTPGDQAAVEGAAGSFALGSFNDTNGNATFWRVDVNWGDGTAHSLFTVNNQGDLGTRAHTFGEERTSPVTVTVTDSLNTVG